MGDFLSKAMTASTVQPGLTGSTKLKTSLSADEFKKALPKQIQGRVSAKVMNGINAILADKDLRDHYKDNLLSYTNVLQQGKFKLSSYIDAVKYVSFKLMGYNNQESYEKAFPVRVQTLYDEGADPKRISAYVAAYNKNKLVNEIWAQTLIPTHVLNAGVFQDAINRQAFLMNNAQSEKVQTDAANSLLNHLKQPETKKVEIDIGVTDDRTIKELRETTRELAAAQRELIASGGQSAKDVAHSKIVTIDHTPVTP